MHGRDAGAFARATTTTTAEGIGPAGAGCPLRLEREIYRPALVIVTLRLTADDGTRRR
jgi:hypothetical protein